MKTRFVTLITLVTLALTSWATTSYAQHRMGGTPPTLIFPEGKDMVEIPFELEREKILIPVRVNGSDPIAFVLDTGAPISVFMDSEWAGTLDLNIVGEAMVGGVGEGEALTVPIAGDVRFELGGIKITGAMMAIGVGEGKLPDVGWVGVIGQPVFANTVVDFDFANRVLRLHRPETFAYKGNGSEIPLTIANGSFPYIETKVSIDGKVTVPATLVIDTGAGMALSLSVENHDDLDMPERTVNGVLGWGANGVVRGRAGRIASLQVGDYVFRDVVTRFPDPSGMHMMEKGGHSGAIARHGMLGVEVLKRFRTIFDYTSSRLILEPNAEYESPFTYNNTGLMPLPWASGAESIEVIYVLESSPASLAGIEVGDHLTAIDGKPVSGFSVDSIVDILEQPAGSKVSFTIRRNTDEFRKELVLKKII